MGPRIGAAGAKRIIGPCVTPPPAGAPPATGPVGCTLRKWRNRVSGSGRSATWVRRITAISAAIIALGAKATSSSAFSSNCHIRDSDRSGKRAAISTPRARSSDATVGSLAASGVILITEIQCVISARSRSTAKGSAPSEYCSASSPKAAAASPRMIISNRSSTRPRSASPSMARTASACTNPAPLDIA